MPIEKELFFIDDYSIRINNEKNRRTIVSMLF